MPTFSVGRISRGTRGVTLLEMMVVVTLIALMAAFTYPSVASGLDSLRLRSAADSILALLDTAADRAERRQQAVEIVISPKDNSVQAVSADMGFQKRVALTKGLRITGVKPGNAPPDANREFLIYPGGTVPALTIEISTASGHRRVVSVDPITGLAQSELPK